MKFIHIADVHLGAKPDAGSAYSANRENEIWETFRSVIERCKEERVELLLIAGDLFHRQPLLRELKEVNYLFSTLTNTQVVMIAGNHDYLRKNSYYRTFHWNENVHMILTKEVSFVELKELDLAVYGLSYHERIIEEPLYDRIQIRDHCRYHILLAHGGDSQHLPFDRASVEKNGFDYVALGHIHKPQELIPGRMIYAGALEPIDRNDVGPHGMVIGTLDENGCRAEFVPVATREYVHMDIEVEEDMTGFALKSQIKERIMAGGVQNIYKINLEGFKDPEIQFDLKNMDVYGNIVEIVDHTRPAYDFARILAGNKENLLGRFIESFQDAEPDSVEYEALCEGVQALLETREG